MRDAIRLRLPLNPFGPGSCTGDGQRLVGTFSALKTHDNLTGRGERGEGRRGERGGEGRGEEREEGIRVVM